MVHESGRSEGPAGVDAAQGLPAGGQPVDGEAEQLHQDVRLVVIHGDHGVDAPPEISRSRVAGSRPVHVVALFAAGA